MDKIQYLMYGKQKQTDIVSAAVVCYTLSHHTLFS